MHGQGKKFGAARSTGRVKPPPLARFLKGGRAWPRLESTGEEKDAAAKASIFGERKGEKTRNQSNASAESKRWRTSSSSSTRRWPRNHHQRKRIETRALKEQDNSTARPHRTPLSAAPLQEPTASLPTPNRRSPPLQIKNGTDIFFPLDAFSLPAPLIRY